MSHTHNTDYDDNVVNDSILHSTDKIGDTFKTNESAVKSVIPENNEEIGTNHGDQRLWVKPLDELFTEQIKEEVQEYEYKTTVDIKDEIEELKEDAMEVEPEKLCHPIEPPVEVHLPKVAMPKVAIPRVAIPKVKVINKKVKKPKGRLGRRPRPILPMTQPIGSANTSHLEQASTPHQIIMPSAQMPGIAYQIFLGDNSKNSNNPVHYTMLQSQPVFLQQTPTSVSTPSPVVISQPSMVMNQHYQMRERKIPLPKIPKIAPKMVNKSYCSFCYKHFNNLIDHIKDCWLNPDSKRYKFRKIAPSTPL